MLSELMFLPRKVVRYLWDQLLPEVVFSHAMLNRLFLAQRCLELGDVWGGRMVVEPLVVLLYISAQFKRTTT